MDVGSRALRAIRPSSRDVVRRTSHLRGDSVAHPELER
jgi:hypothetical protein